MSDAHRPASWSGGGKKSVQAVSQSPPPAPAAEAYIPAPEGPDATDAAKALAAEYGIDLTTVTGTGQDGRIVIGDVDAIIQAATAEPSEPIPDEAEEVSEPPPADEG